MNHNMQRVLVVGSSGAGKTTFARRLAQQIDANYFELDALHWGPDWTPVGKELFRERVTEAVARPRWVSDGNYFSVRDLVWSQATTLVWLDYSFPVVLSRSLRRSVRRVFTRERIFSGNRETFRQTFFSRESILWWVTTSFRPVRREIREFLEREENSRLKVFHFRKSREAEEFLVSLREGEV